MKEIGPLITSLFSMVVASLLYSLAGNTWTPTVIIFTFSACFMLYCYVPKNTYVNVK